MGKGKRGRERNRERKRDRERGKESERVNKGVNRREKEWRYRGWKKTKREVIL